MPAQLMRNGIPLTVGEKLPEISIPLTVTRVMATAIATRDFQPVHHDLERAKSLGSDHVFLNTHSTAGFIERLVMEWAGPHAFLRKVSFRMGMPCYAGDTLVLEGEVIGVDAQKNTAEISITGSHVRGAHVTGTAIVGLPS